MKREILAMIIYENSNGICQICSRAHKLENWERTWEIDHVKPKSKEGSNSIKNLAVLCKSCNRIKSDRTLHELWGEEMELLIDGILALYYNKGLSIDKIAQKLDINKKVITTIIYEETKARLEDT